MFYYHIKPSKAPVVGNLTSVSTIPPSAQLFLTKLNYQFWFKLTLSCSEQRSSAFSKSFRSSSVSYKKKNLYSKTSTTQMYVYCFFQKATNHSIKLLRKNVPLLHPLKTPENRKFFYFFKGYRSGILQLQLNHKRYISVSLLKQLKTHKLRKICTNFHQTVISFDPSLTLLDKYVA